MSRKSFSINRIGEFVSKDLDRPGSAESEEANESALSFIDSATRILFKSFGREATLRTYVEDRKRVTKIFVEPPIDSVVMALDACRELKSSHETIRASFPEGTLGELSIRKTEDR